MKLGIVGTGMIVQDLMHIRSHLPIKKWAIYG